MPKRVKHKRRTAPPDPNQWAHRMMQESTKERPEEAASDFKTQLSGYMSALGSKGGKVSGAKRMQNLSDAKRSEIALRAATARWDKERAKKRRAK